MIKKFTLDYALTYLIYRRSWLLALVQNGGGQYSGLLPRIIILLENRNRIDHGDWKLD
jgi:hypothetical protein